MDIDDDDDIEEVGRREGLPVEFGLELHSAVRSAPAAIVKLLLENGADPNRPDGDGLTPLHHAARFGRADMIQLLMECNVDTETRAGPNGPTPLHLAVSANYCAVADRLLAAGANVNAMYRGWSPLAVAVTNGLSEMSFLLLVNGGATPFPVGNVVCGPLVTAWRAGRHPIQRQRVELVNRLQELSVPSDVADLCGQYIHISDRSSRPTESQQQQQQQQPRQPPM